MQRVVGDSARARTSLVKLCLSSSFADDASVVGTLIFVADAWKQPSGTVDLVAAVAGELVGNGQKQRNQRCFIVRVDLQCIQTDALRRPCLIEQAVALGLLECGRYGIFGDGFESLHTDLTSGNTTAAGAVDHTLRQPRVPSVE